MSNRPIYLDYHASTPVDGRVLQAMLPYFTEVFGNASSRSHAFGWDADSAVSRARAEVAGLVGARSPREIVFTSGATESNNLAIKGVLEAKGGGHIVTSTIEHPCVLEACRHLEQQGVTWTEVGVNADGLVSAADVEAAIRPDTVLVSIMSVNNEVGTVQPIAEIGRITKRRGVLLHTDAAQAAGRISIDVERDGIDLLSLSAHKIYGPKGVGALYVRRFPTRTPITCQSDGGSQEQGLRSGTLNVPGIVGLGAAATLAAAERVSETARLSGLRDTLLEHVRRAVPDVQVHGSLKRRVAANLNLSFPGLDGEIVLNALPEFALSAGSACSSGKIEVSHVLSAMGVSVDLARGAIRIGLGRMSTERETRAAAEGLVRAVRSLRARRDRRTTRGAA